MSEIGSGWVTLCVFLILRNKGPLFSRETAGRNLAPMISCIASYNDITNHRSSKNLELELEGMMSGKLRCMSKACDNFSISSLVLIRMANKATVNASYNSILVHNDVICRKNSHMCLVKYNHGL